MTPKNGAVIAAEMERCCNLKNYGYLWHLGARGMAPLWPSFFPFVLSFGPRHNLDYRLHMEEDRPGSGELVWQATNFRQTSGGDPFSSVALGHRSASRMPAVLCPDSCRKGGSGRRKIQSTESICPRRY